MFEGRRLKKLIKRLGSAESESEKKIIQSQLIEYGQVAFPYIIGAIRAKQVESSRGRILLEKTFSRSHMREIVSLTGDPLQGIRDAAKGIVVSRLKDEAVPLLIKNLKSADMHLRVSAKNILIELKSQRAAETLITEYQNTTDDVKRSIISILGVTGGANVSRFLADRLNDKDRTIRLMAVRGLKDIKDPGSVERLIPVLKDTDVQVRRCAVDALSAIGDKRSAKAVVHLLKDSDLLIRQKAVDCIVATGDAGDVPDILNIMREQDVNARRCAVEVLNSIKDPRTGDELVKAIRDSDWWVREVATDALIHIKNKTIIDAIIRLLGDHDENIRRCAVEFFVRAPAKDAVPPLIELLKDKDWWVREKAIAALKNIKDKRAVKPLLEMTDDEEVKWAVPEALVHIEGDDALDHIDLFLNDRQSRVRMESLRSLKRLKTPLAAEKAKPFLDDPDSEVRSEAVAVLKALTGKTYRTGKGDKNG